MIDIGSNSIKTEVFLLDTKQFSSVFRDKYICKFTKSMDASKIISETAIQAALEHLKKLKRKLDLFKLDACFAIATSAMRIAKNSKDFVEPANEILGTKIKVISAKKEAELAVSGARLEVKELSGLLFDLGGGSLEIISLQKNKIQKISSKALGHQVLAKLYTAGADYCREQISKQLSVIKKSHKKIYLIGGRFRKIAKAFLKTTEESKADFKVSRNKIEEFLAESTEQAKNPTALLLNEILKKSKATEVHFLQNSIREGLLAQL